MTAVFKRTEKVAVIAGDEAVILRIERINEDTGRCELSEIVRFIKCQIRVAPARVKSSQGF